MTKLSHSYSALKLFENCPLRYWHQRVAKTVIDAGSEASRYGERIHKSIELYLRREADLPAELAAMEPVLDALLAADHICLTAEEEIAFNRDFRPTGWWDEDAWLRAKLDVLMRSQTHALIIDWKTGRRRPDFAQLDLFAMVTMLRYPEIQKVQATFVWTRDKAQDTNTYTRSQLDDLVNSLLQKTTRVEQSAETNVWPAKPGPLCRYCPAQSRCEYSA